MRRPVAAEPCDGAAGRPVVEVLIPQIVVADAPGESDRLAVLEPLRAFNAARVGPIDLRPVAILLQTDGATSGGLWGHTAYDWMFVQYLVVPEGLRGQNLGTRLMDAAEALARERGCVGVWLDTYSFQARGFYERRGYAVFGTIDDYPVGHQRHFLTKRL